MNAYNLYGIGDLRFESIDIPDIASGWALVKVKAAGICSSDIPRIYKNGTYHFPTIPGHEFSGIVEKVANNADKHYEGKKVGVFPLIPCKKCDYCKRGKYELCNNYDYIGSRRNGAFAEYVAVPTWNLVELDNGIKYTDAAMMEPLAVSLHSIKQMELKGNEDVAVIGTGMIALSAAQWAILKGARSVTIIGRSDSKRKLVESFENVRYLIGIDHSVQFDAVLEAVGSNLAVEQALSIVKPEGVVVLMGNPEGDIKLEQNIYWTILRKQIIVKGTWNSSYEKNQFCDWSEVQDNLKNKNIQVSGLISHVFNQNELMKALELMLAHKEPYCKVMTLWNEE